MQLTTHLLSLCHTHTHTLSLYRTRTLFLWPSLSHTHKYMLSLFPLPPFPSPSLSQPRRCRLSIALIDQDNTSLSSPHASLQVHHTHIAFDSLSALTLLALLEPIILSLALVSILNVVSIIADHMNVSNLLMSVCGTLSYQIVLCGVVSCSAIYLVANQRRSLLFILFH